MEVETIQVHYVDQSRGKGVYRINAADFDPKIHRRLTDKEETATEALATKTEKDAKK